MARGMGFENPLRLARIRAKWNETLKGPAALHSWPHSLEKTTLTIAADSSAWVQQLSFLKDELVEKLRDHGVKDIRFQTGRVPSPEVPDPPFKPGPLSPEDIELAETEAARVKDEALGDSVRHAIHSWAGRKTRRKSP
jgi:hypothetical protein